MLNKPFRPFAGNTVNLSVSASSQRVEIDNCDSIRIMNNGTATVWVDFGDGTVTAALASGIPVGPGISRWWRTALRCRHSSRRNRFDLLYTRRRHLSLSRPRPPSLMAAEKRGRDV